MKVGINGMGRMGRLALRAAMGGVRRAAGDPRAGNRLDVVHLNEVKGGAATPAHLLEFDSVHGRWHAGFETDGKSGISVDGKRMGFSEAAKPGDIPWGDLGCDIVLECTGKFLRPEELQAYFDRGVKRVIVAAPVKDERALNIVVGVNDHLYDPSKHRLLTAASCTTNCLAPVVKVVHEGLGIRHGQITTIHDPTNTNVVVDFPRDVPDGAVTESKMQTVRMPTPELLRDHGRGRGRRRPVLLSCQALVHRRSIDVAVFVERYA